jgi:hypothetical protein
VIIMGTSLLGRISSENSALLRLISDQPGTTPFVDISASLGSGSLRWTHAHRHRINDSHRGERMRHHSFRTFPTAGFQGCPRSWYRAYGPAKQHPFCFEFDAVSSGGLHPLRGRVHHASRFRGSD